MADFSKINLTKPMLMVLSLLGIYGALKVSEFIYLLLIGQTAQVALSGSVPVPQTINETMNATLNSVATGFAAFNIAELVILGLISLVVIIQIFWPLISQYIPKGKKGKGMN